MALTFLFGGVIATSLIVTEAFVVANREDMEGYFNVPGMILVILSLTLIVTQIPSLICQIKIMIFNKSMRYTDAIDEDQTNKEIEAWRKIPSKFLRNTNFIYAVTILLNYIYMLIVDFVIDGESNGFLFVLIVSVVLSVCGIILILDAHKLKKKVKEMALIHNS